MKQLMFLDTIMVSNSMFGNLTSRNPFYSQWGKAYQNIISQLENIKILIKDLDDYLMLMIASFLVSLYDYNHHHIYLSPCLHLQRSHQCVVTARLLYIKYTNSLAWFCIMVRTSIFFSLIESNKFQIFE